MTKKTLKSSRKRAQQQLQFKGTRQRTGKSAFHDVIRSLRVANQRKGTE